MYIRYEVNSTATGTTALQLFMGDLVGIFSGSITSVSGLSASCNTTLSTWTGALNGTLYSVISSNVSATSTHNNHIRLQKFHSLKTTGYTPASVMTMWGCNRASSAQGLFRFGSSNSTNVWPGGVMPPVNTTQYAGFFDDTNTTYTSSINSAATGNLASWLSRILIWANDNCLIFHLILTDGSMQTGGIFDYEPSASDQYAYNLNSLCSPQLYLSSVWRSMTGNSAITASNICGLAIGRGPYLQNNNTVFAGTTPFSLDLHYGNQGNTASSLATSIYPLPRFCQYPAGLSSGTSHFITPVYFMPGFNNTTSSQTTFGRIPSFYRTTDDIADSGELITDSNSVTYAVLRLHKTKGYAAADFANQTPNACYLIPV